MSAKLRDLNPAQRIAYVEHQVFEAQKGHVDMIECPYCGLGLQVGVESLCCELMAEAVAAVLLKIELRDQLDHCARVAENADNMVQLAVN